MKHYPNDYSIEDQEIDIVEKIEKYYIISRQELKRILNIKEDIFMVIDVGDDKVKILVR